MGTQMKIAGFLKVRSEVLHGNLYRVLANLDAIGVTCGVLCDDASNDGTSSVLDAFAAARPGWVVLHVDPAEQAFERELAVKQRMLDMLAPMAPDWVYWTDGDETLDAKGTSGLREWIADLGPEVIGARFHYTQLWMSTSWARTDDGFDDGFFLRLWRYSPDLTFDTRGGTHRSQFPTQLDFSKSVLAPFDVIHWGNGSKKALQFKAHQYAGGLGGVDRHLAFGHTPDESLATGVGYDLATWSRPYPTYRQVDADTLPAAVPGEVRTFDAAPPKPFTMEEIRRIRSMGNMRGLEGWFTVVVPAFNRAPDLPRALNSLLAQRYEKWIAVVLDDGSTDNTSEVMNVYQNLDPRIFSCRYAENRGGVAVNEIGMALACEFGEYWSRLGSDDWWGPGKLEADVAALAAGAEATFGPFTVWRRGAAAEVCAGSWGPSQGLSPSARLRAGQFLASWANVAVRTSVLRKVRERWGNFCDPSLRNMEDFCVNARVAHLAEWVWRPGDPIDAWWNCLEAVGAPETASASANAAVTARDEAITQKLIAAMG